MTRDLAFSGTVVTAFLFDQDRNLGKVTRRARRGPGENHVVHAPAAKRLRARFAHRPTERFEKVGLAAAIGANDARQSSLDPELGRLDEALEAAELEASDLQAADPSPD